MYTVYCIVIICICHPPPKLLKVWAPHLLLTCNPPTLASPSNVKLNTLCSKNGAASIVAPTSLITVDKRNASCSQSHIIPSLAPPLQNSSAWIENETSRKSAGNPKLPILDDNHKYAPVRNKFSALSDLISYLKEEENQINFTDGPKKK